MADTNPVPANEADDAADPDDCFHLVERPATFIDRNDKKQILIRQVDIMGNEDSVIVLGAHDVPPVVARLQRLAAEILGR